MLNEMFATEVRSTGVSVAYQAGALIAGFLPLTAGGLLAAAGGGGGGTNIGSVAVLVMVVSVLGAVAVWTGRESRGSDLREVGGEPGAGGQRPGR
ncbi:hypothetical protein [Nonomuraea sp. NPDC046570]|uniref:hypothetical protein n=1 Tax=Nonomuraea sp. NPDC046570 TaxID=3155255 RepID=UPI0033C6353E